MKNLVMILILISINVNITDILSAKTKFLPFDYKKTRTVRYNDWRKIRTNPLNIFADKAIRFFQKRLSPLDGDNCQFYPTCSQYARIAFRKYGFLKGWILASDRLLRCNHLNVKIYPFAKGRHSWRRYDPVP